MIRLKIMITLDVDTEDYYASSDEKIEEDIEDHLGDLIYEIDGCELKSIKVLKGERR
tara:strand:- start:3 stop:173 length:171 start_codon:yes stop_codon:yes gene_type:complete